MTQSEIPEGPVPESIQTRKIVAIPAVGTEEARIDPVAVEAPLELRINGQAETVMMRTPGHDEELVLGFLYAENVISEIGDIVAMERPNAENIQIIDVKLTSTRKFQGMDRPLYSNSSCGVCGKRSLASLEVHGPRLESDFRLNRNLLCPLPGRLRKNQKLFSETGGVHAAGLFSPEGSLVTLREDVGRHNALDKLIGWALSEGLVPLNEFILLLSGRVSYELIQKAIRASIPVVAAVGAPSTLAIELAEQFGITLLGFLKNDHFNCYSHSSRIAL
ncbi:formate dehydrogenase accessory sulfurtransferase FdhD [Telmatocola sphagniphila]|uniref:Sulfur carrier protein FdhD n=1 Tax=Telmatocola sphagniphila TaxID=1123043 RepID=A0A8E6EXL3_9BACT|nr:formate dehydrogenase accessory sulfurtransferase FdhD [Telmatocola sphagniphila]QVL31748.1 formate dehydrogenase accessory sulfurtransferase FdhD [Telmatocola sphagniphila]